MWKCGTQKSGSLGVKSLVEVYAYDLGYADDCMHYSGHHNYELTNLLTLAFRGT